MRAVRSLWIACQTNKGVPLGIRRRVATLLSLFTLLTGTVAALSPVSAVAEHTPNPTSVAIAGSLQDELGCPGDWQPDCADTDLGFDAEDDIWQGAFSLPAGSYEYKAAINDSWDENYGANAVPNGANIALNLGAATVVKFYYDHKTHWVTDNVNSTIVTVAGSFQSELGCSGDWQPSCLRSWMQDIDGDGIYTFVSDQIPAGSYEFKVALNEGWDVTYPGSNVAFAVSDGATVTFTYDSATNDVSVDTGSVSPVADPNGPYSALVGEPVTFDGSGSVDADGTIVSYGWDFGDGGTGTGVAPSHAYAAAGIYSVTLTVTDNEGATDTASAVATIVGSENFEAIATNIQDLDLAKGTENSFLKKIQNAQKSFDNGDIAGACDKLASFVDHVTAQDGQKLTSTAADELRATAQVLMEAIGCSAG